MTIHETLTEVFRVVFDNEEIQISPETTAGDIDGWDSLSHVNLITAIETRFHIRFEMQELLTFQKVGDLIESIQSKTGLR